MRNLTFVKTIIFLSLIILFCGIMPTKADAAGYYIRWKYAGTECDMTIETGQKFYIGDYVMITYGTEYYTGSMVKGSYASSAKKIATVNGKGYVNTKKVGTADITFKYQGQTLTAHLNVIKKGSFDYISQYKSSFDGLKTAAKSLSVPNKITAGNVFTYLRKSNTFLATWGRNICKYTTYDGFANTYIRPENNTVNEDRSNDLIVPQAGRYLTLLAKLRQFANNNNPVSTKSSKNNFSVTKATGSAGTITVTLKKAVSAAQIAAIKIKYPSLNASGDSNNQAYMTIEIKGPSTYYRGNVTLKKGSKSVTVKVVENAFPYNTAVTFTKGTKYSFRFTPDKLTSFTAK